MKVTSYILAKHFSLDKMSNNENNTMTVQVVLEYQWTSSRDLIPDIQASIKDLESGSVSLGSILESLTKKGFELSGEQRISYKNHEKAINVFIGKVAD